MDNKILAMAYYLMNSADTPVVLVTKDLNLRIKADVLGIATEDFYSDKVDYHKLYKGVRELYVSREEIDRFYQEGCLDCSRDNLYPNQFCILKFPENPSVSALARYADHKLSKLVYENKTVYGIKGLNKEQKFALDLLLDDHLKIVTLVGKAGTGKTILALAAGLEKVFEDNGRYNRLLITRPIVPLGNDLGYLPGDKEDKIRPWMQPIYDNLEYLCNEHIRPNGSTEYLLTSGKIEMEALTYIRGRSIPPPVYHLRRKPEPQPPCHQDHPHPGRPRQQDRLHRRPGADRPSLSGRLFQRPELPGGKDQGRGHLRAHYPDQGRKVGSGRTGRQTVISFEFRVFRWQLLTGGGATPPSYIQG